MAEIKDTMDRMVRTQNPVEELLLKIPGFRGYLDKEARRESDKLHRDYLAKKLDEAKRHVTRVKSELVDEGKILQLEKLDRLVDRLDGSISRIRYADRGYSGFFDAVKMDDEALQTLHQLDLALVEQVTAVEVAIRRLDADLADPELKDAVKGVGAAIESLDTRFAERDDVVSGVK